MRNLLLLVLLLNIVLQIQSQQTFCTKYSQALRVKNKILVESVVNKTIGEVIKPQNGLKRFFDGTHPNQTINYIMNVNALNFLRNNLVAFFGAALGCQDGSIPPYSGRDMHSAHGRLYIDYFAYAQFNRIIIEVLDDAGVTSEDQHTVANVLNTLRGAVCIAEDCGNLCNSYSVPSNLDNLELVGSVVDGVVSKALGSMNLKQYFNGQTPPGSIDFTSNPQLFAILRNHLIEFFGMALGCTDRTIGVYNGRSLRDAHRFMGINFSTFKEFNNAITSTLASAGVRPSDVSKVAGVLDSLKCFICTAADCQCM